MNTKLRSYQEGCVAAHALDLIGDRWSLLVVRELMLGAKRFGAIKAGLPGVATNILTDRLAVLEAAGVLTHQTLPPPANAPVYALTTAGEGLREVIDALCRWGVRQPGHDPRQWISPTALMLSMRCFHTPGAALTAGFTLGPEVFTVTTGPVYRITRDDPAAAPLRFTAPPNRMAAAVYGPITLAQTIRFDLVAFEGDPAAGQDFLGQFALPI